MTKVRWAPAPKTILPSESALLPKRKKFDVEDRVAEAPSLYLGVFHCDPVKDKDE